MNSITIDDIRGYNPCYDPSRYLPQGWSGTALDILAVEACPPQDRLWVVLHEECLDARTLRLFAVWCARTALTLVDDPDPRSIAACNVAERYANGDATAAELYAAQGAAWAAAQGAAWAAAWAAAAAAAEYAARGAAEYAARAAAEYAARSAARAAAQGAARSAARAAARAAQVRRLREMITMSQP